MSQIRREEWCLVASDCFGEEQSRSLLVQEAVTRLSELEAAVPAEADEACKLLRMHVAERIAAVRALTATIARRRGRPESADDVASLVVTALLMQPPTDLRKSLTAYAAGIAENKLRDLDRKRDAVVPSTAIGDEVAAPGPPDDVVEFREIVALMLESLSPRRLRDVLEMSLNGYTADEAARELGISKLTYNSYLYQARRRAAEWLEGAGYKRNMKGKK